MEDTAKREARAVGGVQGAVQEEGVISGLCLWRRHYPCQGAAVPAVCRSGGTSTRGSGRVGQDTLALCEGRGLRELWAGAAMCRHGQVREVGFDGVSASWCSALRGSCSSEHLLHSFNNFSVVLKCGLAIQGFCGIFPVVLGTMLKILRIVGSLGLNEMFWVQCL